MFAWRILGTVGVLLAAVPSGWGQSYPLAEAVQTGDCFRVTLDMKLSGEMRIRKPDGILPLKLEATGSHTFPERVLAVGAAGLAEKSARVYETAKASITVGKDTNERILRDDRHLLVAQRVKDQLLVYSPAGTLRREELDLTAGHFDTLAVTGLLPGKSVAVGDTWEVPNAVAQAVCNFEGLIDQKLTGKLEGVKDQGATFSITGTANGIDMGARVQLKVEATCTFDLAAKRLVALEWKQKDERDQGPVSPATAVEMTTKLTRKSVEQPAELSDVALVSVPDGEPPVPLTNLEYRDARGRFELLHAREWQMVSQTTEHVVFRLMDRGDFVAQATLTPWTAAEKDKHLTPAEFKQAMNETPGWEPEKELQAGEVPSEGRWVYRLSVLGQLDGVAVLQNFYLVAAPGGEQMVVTFTLTPKQVDKLGPRDLTFVGSLEVPAAKK
jgi:hypothetical protein